MRTTILLLATALSLAACGAETSDDATTSPAATPSAAAGVAADGPFPSTEPAVSGDPALTFPDGDPGPGLQRQVLTEGEGDVVEAGDLLVADYLGQVWGGEVFDGSFDGDPAAFSIGTGSVIQGWDSGLVGQTVGSRVLLTIPPDLGYGDAGNPAAGIGGTDTIVFVVDLLGSYGPEDAGDPGASATDTETGPTVAGDLGGPATVEVPAGTPEPAETRTTVLATGTGEPVVAGGIVVQYAVALWDNSSTGSTWDSSGPEAVGVGDGGEFDSLIGVPVGSRVLLEFPSTGEDSPAVAAVVDIVDQFDQS